jgi:hypothetical protein
VHALLAFKVFVKKSAVILKGFSLYVIWFSSHTGFNNLSNFSGLVALMITYPEEVLFWSSLFGVLEASCT